jgi:TonB family protein
MPRFLLPALTLALAGCAAGAPRTGSGDRSARLVPGAAPVSCAEWVRRAVAKPDLDVERVPTPLAYNPSPVPKRLPPGAAGRDGRAEVRIQVVVDTLGRADMKSFRVVRSTHPKLTETARHAVARWKFQPAVVGGCKVPRIFKWGAVAGQSTRRASAG